ncbi:YybH family protein [Kordiimonas lipolytica]|uniref:YybH family protein n=1 Tax=Kordiimonas lipolytica TaxID=1662421 RepID=A0ABV8UD76_9PROT|nr:nuclear transport factor 2 family protein [Kordiimonas lipolytica]
MINKFLRKFVVFSAFLIVSGCSQADNNSDDHAASVEAEIDEVAIIKTIEGRFDTAFHTVWSKDHDAETFVHEYLTPDAVITASDSPTTWSGYDELVPLMVDLIASYPGITAESVFTRVASETVVYQFAQFTFHPADSNADTIPAKSLYVWVHRDGKWKITADHFSYTLMDVPSIAK